jgi:serine/threonine protein kinase
MSAGIVRYAAPEIIESANYSATTYSDIYSFALMILECITEKVPFSRINPEAAVVHARITKKQYPPRPDGQHEENRVSDELWDLMKRCWSIKPDERPRMEAVHHFFLDRADDRRDGSGSEPEP